MLHICTASPSPLLQLRLVSPLGPLVVGNPIHASIDLLVYVSVPVVSEGDFSAGFPVQG